MISQEEFKQALKEKIEESGSQAALAEKIGKTQSQISDYLRGRFQVMDMTIGQLYCLFPDAQIDLKAKNQETSQLAMNLEQQLMEIYRNLPPEMQVRFFAMAAANFGSKLKTSY